MEDKDFVSLVKSNMEELGSSRGISQEGDQFAIWFGINILQEKEGDTIDKYHIGGRGDNKLDIGILDQDHSAVLIVQCKYCNDPILTEDGRYNFNVDLPEEVYNAYERLKSIPDSGNEKRRDFALKFSSNEKPVRLLAVGFGKFNRDAFEYANMHDIEIYDFNKIKRRYIYNQVLEQTTAPGLIRLSVDPSERISQSIPSIGLKQWVFLLKINQIYNLLKEHKDGIFQKNLRFKLEKSSKSGIGKEIYTTIMGKNADAFSILNNGITLVAKRVVDEETHSPGLIDPQIVNGCQSSWAIYDALQSLEQAGKDIDSVNTKILVKLIQTSEDKFTDLITRSTNKQNPITIRDTHSMDQYQTGIALAFKNNRPPIFYDHREGLWESICRENQQSQYRIAGRSYRRINNQEAGQLYLALLGKPFYSKQNKSSIFDDQNYYTVIFRTDLEPEKRFNNSALSLDQRYVKLVSGVEFFKKDVIFAYGIYQLADAIKKRYKDKLKSYPQNPDGLIKTAYEMLGNFQFLNSWHYLLISLIHCIINNWKEKGETIENIRKKLIGSNINEIFGARLYEKFNLNNDNKIAIILDEDNPSAEYNIFARWTQTIILELGKEIEKIKERPDFSVRSYIDQRPDTYVEMRDWIDRQYTLGTRNWNEKFPI